MADSTYQKTTEISVTYMIRVAITKTPPTWLATFH